MYRLLLSKINESEGKYSYQYDDQYYFHLIIDNGITFLCMTDAGMKRRTAFAFLEDIKTIWRERYSSIEQSALPFSMNELFSPILQLKMTVYSSKSPPTDKLTQVQTQLDAVKEVMVENIDQILERGNYLY